MRIHLACKGVCILLISFFVFARKAGAQNPADPISIQAVNEKYLEHLIKEKIDEVRLAHNLKPLANDSILYVAAKHHAEYLYNKKELSHTEPEYKEFETPQKRAEYYGAVNYLVGENVAFTAINVPVKGKKEPVHTNETYEQTATDLVTMWVHSPGHYKNIITASYNSTGLAVWVDEKTNRIYAVQKFANVLYKYTFNENKQFFNYSDYKSPRVVTGFEEVGKEMHAGKHAYKLKAPTKPKNCTRCDEALLEFSFGKTHIEFKNRSVFLVSYSLDAIIRLLKKRKDGFAAEIVVYEPYDCGNPQYYTNPTRRNGQCIFSGIVLKPVYGKKALAAFHAGTKRKLIEEKIGAGKVKKYSLKLGELPKDVQGNIEVNLVIIQKKKVCHVKHFTGYCADTLNKFFSLPFFPDTISATAKINETYQNFSFSIPFQKGKTDYKLADIKPLTDSLISESFVADTLVIKAYSSVEGQAAVNKKIQDERAANITKALAGKQKEKLVMVCREEENWELFDKQVKEKADLKDLRGLSHEQIREKLQDTLLQKKTEKYLALQRKAQIRLHAKEIIDSANIEKYLRKRVNRQRNRMARLLGDERNNAALKRCVDTLDNLMEISFQYIRDGKIDKRFFELFEISKDKAYNTYNLRRLKYWLLLHSVSEDSLDWIHQAYDQFVSLYNNGERSFFIIYNMLNLIQQHGKEIQVTLDPHQQDGYIEELKRFAETPRQDSLATMLGLNFWFNLCRDPEELQPKDRIDVYRKSLQGIHAYFEGKTLKTSEKNKLANFYLLHNQATWTIDLLMPDFKSNVDNPEGMKILAKVLYQYYENESDKGYYEFLRELHTRMSKEQWCSMFIGDCNISFQALDYEEFRDFYCAKCRDYMNKAKAPVKK